MMLLGTTGLHVSKSHTPPPTNFPVSSISGTAPPSTQTRGAVLSPLLPLTSHSLALILSAPSPSPWPRAGLHLTWLDPQPSLLPALPASSYPIQCRADLPLPCSQASHGSPVPLAKVPAPQPRVETLGGLSPPPLHPFSCP